MPDSVDDGNARLAEDTRVGDFRIRGLVGEGAMGEVYLAQDTTLGRRVALKFVRRSIADADAVARFLEEARATASFAHPHIVTLHAVGQHEGRPYLALEYIDGETLRVRLAAGPLPVPEALRLAQAIADAIAEAHRRGIVHADLKPENVVIPRDGRVRVVDFGLAKLAGDAPGGASGTPAYMAPERWRQAPPSGAIDVWALGVILHELVTGRRPYGEAQLAMLAYSRDAKLPPLELPAAPWAALVQDCLALDPAARPAADELLRRIAALLDPRAASETAADARCPFPGLAAFTRDNAADYFGRRGELDAVVEQLRTRALVPIVGASGTGKSSFVRAALLPRLDEAGRWAEITLRPGSAPLDNLAAALALPGRSAESIAESLRRYPDSLSLVLADVAQQRGARVLLFVDQFEETFTLARSEADALAFCDCLARAAVPGEPWRIVLTLRDDFLGRLAAAPTMRRHLGEVMVLPPLSAADLREAVTGPLANAGYEPDAPDLVARIVADVEGRPACLPLLQFACRSLWERRDAAARRILAAEYHAMGGATGALAKHAQRLMSELTADEVRAVRGILLALLHPDGTRRPRLREELLESVPAAQRPAAGGVLERLLDRRLVVATRDAERDETMYEVAHEALATAWPQLSRWLDETYEERLLVTELEQASRRWEARGRRDEETWTGVALADAARKVDDWDITLPSVSRAFLEASQARDRRLRRRRRWLVTGVIVALASAAAAAAIAAFVIARESETLKLVAADRGKIELVLRPFDWDAAAQQKRDVRREPAGWRWTLRAAPRGALDPGPAYEGDKLRRGVPAWRGKAFVEQLEVRSGPAFLVVERPGCADSVLRLIALPGYDGGASSTTRIEIDVPTCAASATDMVEIPEGAFISHDGSTQSLPRYWIDRTEVTRAAFAVFEAMSELHGHPTPPGPPRPKDKAAHEQEWRLPIAHIRYVTAYSYCRFMGKELPSFPQWLKAARGGIDVDRRKNEAPARRTPWLTTESKRPANLKLDAETESELAPVATYLEDRSPYGVMDLAGNVSEWSRDPSTDMAGLRAVLGGNWGLDELGKFDLARDNARLDEFANFGVGMRCAAGDR